MMNKEERLRAAIAGEAVDRVPVSIWRHQPVDDQSGPELAAATLAFQREFDFDFVKVTPASSYCVRDWGAQDVWRGHYHGTREYGERVIRSPEGWAELATFNPRTGQSGEILHALDLIGSALGASTPFIQTIFSPLTQARNLAGNDRLLRHLRRYPDALHAGLRTIADQTLSFIEAARGAGLSGLFYAVQWASYQHLSADEYASFGKPYDLEILSANRNLWLNVLHLHGDDIMFDLAADYPVSIMNWHDRETPPTLAEGQRRFSGAVCGGIRQEATLMAGTAEDVRREALAAIAETGAQRFVLGTGCVAPIVTPYGNLRAARDVVEAVPPD